MKYLIVFLVLLSVAVLTNPKKEEHIAAVRDLLAASMNDALKETLSDSKNEWQFAGGLVGTFVGMSFVDKFLENLVFRKNYFVFSLTEVRFEGNSRVIGVGLFGHVWLFADNSETLLNK